MEHSLWMFWFVPPLMFMLLRRRRRDGWGPRGPRGWHENEEATALRREVEEQREYTLALEDRVAQLEERIDFTERLLAGRREASPLE
jgi:hypothetical protein